MSQSTAKSEPTRGRSAGDDLELGAAEALSRQADDCRRAGAERAAQREVSAMQACHADNNGQAEPRAAFLAQVGVAHLVERRSEEHTSELQSLMRISYAVFCLKKKTHCISHRNRQNGA